MSKVMTKDKYERCPKCDIAFFSGEQALWCSERECPETKQRGPTATQMEKLKMENPSSRPRSSH